MNVFEKDIRFKGQFGIERETLRVTADGRLAKTLHPFTEAELSRDFCENQLEIITPVCNSIDEAIDSLNRLSKQAQEVIRNQGEYLWMYSNPPHIEGEEEIPIAQYGGAQKNKQDYRIKLARRYRKVLMLYSGIHFNLSFDPGNYNNTQGEKDVFYMKLLKYATRYSWLLTYLAAASPVYDESLAGRKDWKNLLDKGDLSNKDVSSFFSGYGSMRNSEHGYWNQFVPELDYSSMETYCNSIRELICKGALFSEGELYMPARLKSAGAYCLDCLQQNGVSHIELRMFDLNPLYSLGIAREDLFFAHYFMVYLSTLGDFEFTKEMQKQAIENHKNAARYYSSDIEIVEIVSSPSTVEHQREDKSKVCVSRKNINEAARDILYDMQNVFSEYEEVQNVVKYQLKKLESGNRYAEKIYENLKVDYLNTMLAWIQKYKY